MTNSDREGQIFLSHPHTNNGFLFLLTSKYHIYIGKRLPENPKFGEMRHGDVILTLQRRHRSCAASVLLTCGCSFFLSFPQAGMHIREMDLSHMDKNYGNPDLVCEICYFLMSPNEGEDDIVFVVDPVSADAFLCTRYLMNKWVGWNLI